MQEELRIAFAQEVVLSRRTHPRWQRALSYALTRGEVVAVLPGVYAPREIAEHWRVRAHAACCWDPDAVVVGDAAAALTYWPELTPKVVTVAGRRTAVERRGMGMVQRRIPPEFIRFVDGIRCTSADLTAVDLAATRGGDAIDRALRSRMATLAGMYEALAAVPNRRGNADRRRLLIDSRDEPWSAAERLAHRLLRGAGIGGWRANVPFDFDGKRYFLDIAFSSKPLVIEIDGREHHIGKAFDEDRRRGNDLVLARRTVLHFTPVMLEDEPEMFVDVTARALALW